MVGEVYIFPQGFLPSTHKKPLQWLAVRACVFFSRLLYELVVVAVFYELVVVAVFYELVVVAVYMPEALRSEPLSLVYIKAPTVVSCKGLPVFLAVYYLQ